MSEFEDHFGPVPAVLILLMRRQQSALKSLVQHDTFDLENFNDNKTQYLRYVTVASSDVWQKLKKPTLTRRHVLERTVALTFKRKVNAK